MSLLDFSLPASDPTNPNGITSASDLQRRLLAAQLMQKNGADTSPIQSPWQGAARMVQAALGGWDEGQMNRQSAAGAKANSDALAAALGGMGGGTVTATPAAAPAPAASADAGAIPGSSPTLASSGFSGPASIAPYANAIAKVESAGSGDYAAKGPVLDSGDRAYGRYQVMGANIPQWTKAALGHAMTAQEFLASPQAQDAVFAQQFGNSVQKYGNPNDAASVWFTGRPLAQAGAGASDGYATNGQYQDKFSRALAQQLAMTGGQPAAAAPTPAAPAQAPTQVASLGSLSGIGGGGAALPASAPLPPPKPASLGGAPAPTQVAATTPDTEDDAAPTPAAGGQVAAAAPSATPQAQAAPARPAIDTQKLLQVISSPYSTPAQQQIATALLQAAVKPKDPIHVGDSLVDPTTYKTLYSAPAKADATPTSVREYEYGLAHPDFVTQQQALKQKAEGNHVVSPGAVLLDPKGNVIYQNKGADMTAPETQNTVDFLARRVLAGDPQALTNLGRGAQGGEMVRAVQSRVAELAKESNIDPKTILGNQADFAGQKAEQRTLGTQNARVTSAATEAKGAAQMALDAMDNLPRSSVVPANKLWQMGESALSDPNLKFAQLALMTLKNTYARAINPNGTPHMGDKEHFDQLMSTADGPEATHAAIGQILREVEMAQQSPAKAMKILQNVRAGKPALDGVEEGFGSSTAAPTAAPQVNVPGAAPTHVWTPNGGLQKVQP